MLGLQTAMHLLISHVSDALHHLQLTYTLNSIFFTHQDKDFSCSKVNIV